MILLFLCNPGLSFFLCFGWTFVSSLVSGLDMPSPVLRSCFPAPYTHIHIHIHIHIVYSILSHPASHIPHSIPYHAHARAPHLSCRIHPRSHAYIQCTRTHPLRPSSISFVYSFGSSLACLDGFAVLYVRTATRCLSIEDWIELSRCALKLLLSVIEFTMRRGSANRLLHSFVRSSVHSFIQWTTNTRRRSVTALHSSYCNLTIHLCLLKAQAASTRPQTYCAASPSSAA